jgi:peroxiredoxin
MHREVLACALLLLALAGCNSKPAQPTVGTYRAVLELPGGAAPFGLQIARENDRYVMYLTNGAERTRVPNVQVQDGELQVIFPGYENSLRASIEHDALKGTVTLIKDGGVEQKIPFAAKLGEQYRFFAKPQTDNFDLAGRWQLELTNDAGEVTQAVALFEQEHAKVTGTVMTPTGDHRFLEGEVHGDEIWLSTFAGGLAYLYKLRVNAAGELLGEYWQGMKSHSKVAARRNADAQLVELDTRMKSDSARFDFTFRDLDGHSVSLSDARFQGKVVLVTLGGSWCPNCHDEAAFLAPFYREYRERGFEVIALMFERHGDFDKAAKAVRNYRNDLGIEFTTLVAGVSADDDASQKLPALEQVYGYPTSVFIDRQGKVRKIHTGFTGPATGQHYTDYVREFRALVDELLAEHAGTDVSSPVKGAANT